MSFVCLVDGSVDRCQACACLDSIWECDPPHSFPTKSWCANVEIRFKTRLSTTLVGIFVFSLRACASCRVPSVWHYPLFGDEVFPWTWFSALWL